MSRFLIAGAAALVAACSANSSSEDGVDPAADADIAIEANSGIDEGGAANVGDGGNVAGNGSEAGAPAPPAPPTATPGAPSAGAPDSGPTPAPAIPAQYQGRWGMVALDCTGDASAAKGLITINATGIRFYEARATLAEQRPAIATAFSGLFNYVGEGQRWTRVETLTRTGDTLTRANEEGSFRYTRCR